MESGLLTRDQDDEEEGTCDDLDLYDDIITEDNNRQKQSYSEMLEKFESAIKKINKLEQENDSLRHSVDKLTLTSDSAQKNVSSVLITARAEVQRKDTEIKQLRKQLSGIQRLNKGLRNNTSDERIRDSSSNNRERNTDYQKREPAIYHRLRDSDHSDLEKQSSDYECSRRERNSSRRDRYQTYRKNDSDIDERKKNASDGKVENDRNMYSTLDKRDSDHDSGTGKKGLYRKDKNISHRKDRHDRNNIDAKNREENGSCSRDRDDKHRKRDSNFENRECDFYSRKEKKSSKRGKDRDYRNNKRHFQKGDSDVEQESLLQSRGKNSKPSYTCNDKEKSNSGTETKMSDRIGSSSESRKEVGSRSGDTVIRSDRHVSSKDSSQTDTVEASLSNVSESGLDNTCEIEQNIIHLTCTKTKGTNKLFEKVEIDSESNIVTKRMTQRSHENTNMKEKQGQTAVHEKMFKDKKSRRKSSNDSHSLSKVDKRTQSEDQDVHDGIGVRAEEKTENKTSDEHLDKDTESIFQKNKCDGFDLRQKLKSKKEAQVKNNKNQEHSTDDEDKLPIKDSNYVLSENLFTKRSRSKAKRADQNKGIDDIEKDRLFLEQLKHSTVSKCHLDVGKQHGKKSSYSSPMENRKVIDYSDSRCFDTYEKESDSTMPTLSLNTEIGNKNNTNKSKNQAEVPFKQTDFSEKLNNNSVRTECSNKEQLDILDKPGSHEVKSTDTNENIGFKEMQETQGRKIRKHIVEDHENKLHRSVISETVSAVTSTVLSPNMSTAESAAPPSVDTLTPLVSYSITNDRSKSSPNKVCGKLECSIKVNHLHPKTSPMDKAKVRIFEKYPDEQCNEHNIHNKTENVNEIKVKKKDKQNDRTSDIVGIKSQAIVLQKYQDNCMQTRNESMNSNLEKKTDSIVSTIKKNTLTANTEASTESDSTESLSVSEDMDSDSSGSMHSDTNKRYKTVTMNETLTSKDNGAEKTLLPDTDDNAIKIVTDSIQSTELATNNKLLKVKDKKHDSTNIVPEQKELSCDTQSLQIDKNVDYISYSQSKDCSKQDTETDDKKYEGKEKVGLEEKMKEIGFQSKKNTPDHKIYDMFTEPPDKSYLLRSLVLGVESIMKNRELDDPMNISPTNDYTTQTIQSDNKEIQPEVKKASDLELLGNPQSVTSESSISSSSDSGSFSDSSDSDSFSCSCSDCSARASSSSLSSCSSSDDDTSSTDDDEHQNIQAQKNHDSHARDNVQAINIGFSSRLRRENKETVIPKTLPNKETKECNGLNKIKYTEPKMDKLIKNDAGERHNKLIANQANKNYCAKEISPCVLKLSKEISISNPKDQIKYFENVCKEVVQEKSYTNKVINDIKSKARNRIKHTETQPFDNCHKSGNITNSDDIVLNENKGTPSSQTENILEDRINSAEIQLQHDKCAIEKQITQGNTTLNKHNSVANITETLESKDIKKRSNDNNIKEGKSGCGQTVSDMSDQHDKLSDIEKKSGKIVSKSKEKESKEKRIIGAKDIKDVSFSSMSLEERSKEITNSKKIEVDLNVEKSVQQPVIEPYEVGEICTYHLQAYKIPKLKEKQKSKTSRADSQKTVLEKTSYVKPNGGYGLRKQLRNTKCSPLINTKSSPVVRKKKTVVSKPYISTSESDSDTESTGRKHIKRLSTPSNDGHLNTVFGKSSSFTNRDNAEMSSVNESCDRKIKDKTLDNKRKHKNMRKGDTDKNITEGMSKTRDKSSLKTKVDNREHQSTTIEKQTKKQDHAEVVQEDDLVSPRSSILEYASKLVKEMIESKSEEEMNCKTKSDKVKANKVITENDSKELIRKAKEKSVSSPNEMDITHKIDKSSNKAKEQSNDETEKSDSINIHKEKSAAGDFKHIMFGKENLEKEISKVASEKSKANDLVLDIHVEETLDFFDEFEDICQSQNELRASKTSSVSASDNSSLSSEDGEISDDSEIETALIQYKQSPTKPDKLFQEKVQISESDLKKNKLIFQRTKKFSPIKFLPSPDKTKEVSEHRALDRTKRVLRRLAYKDLDSPGHQLDEHTSRDSFSSTQFRSRIRNRDNKYCSYKENRNISDSVSGYDSRSSFTERSDKKHRRRHRRRSESYSPRENRQRERSMSPLYTQNKSANAKRQDRDRKNKIHSSKRKRSLSREGSRDGRRKKESYKSKRRNRHGSSSSESKKLENRFQRNTDSRSNRNEAKTSDKYQKGSEKRKNDNQQNGSVIKRSSAKHSDMQKQDLSVNDKIIDTKGKRRNDKIMTCSSSDTEYESFRHQKRKHLQSSTDYDTDSSFDQLKCGRSSKKVRKDS